MKKLVMILAASLLLLSGCSDAYANITDGSTAIVTVGNKSITKKDLYEALKLNYASYESINNATKYIAEQEVPVTEEIEKEADDTITTYQTYFGDDLETQLQAAGYENIDAYRNELILASQMTKLTSQYVTANWDTLVTTYNPKKVIVLSFDEQSDADAALTELNNDTDPSEVATAYNSSSTGLEEILLSDSTTYAVEVKSLANSSTAEDGYTEVPGSDGKFYVMKVVESDPENFKDEAIQTLSNVSTMAAECDNFYFKKYNFHVYDRDLYDDLHNNYPNYLVQ